MIDAAVAVFAAHGFRGSTIEEVAAEAGMSKANVLYYFPTKAAIHLAALEDVLDAWLAPFAALDPDGDPLTELCRYMDAKLRLSVERPDASRLFANEILHGAPAIGGVLRTRLKALVDRKAELIGGWIAAGRLAPVDPHHLIFAIWATTQHYADFAAQLDAIAPGPPAERLEAARRTLRQLLTAGLAAPPTPTPRSTGDGMEGRGPA